MPADSVNSEHILQLLEEFKISAVSSERKNAKSLLLQHQQLCDTICDLFVHKYSDQSVMENLCQELLTLYYRGGGSKCLCIQTLPAAVGTYIFAVALGKRKFCAPLETFLLSIYNNEVAKKTTNDDSVEEIRLHPLISPSIYHKEPSTLLTGTTFIDNGVNKCRANFPVTVKIGPYPSCAALNAENNLCSSGFDFPKLSKLTKLKANVSSRKISSLLSLDSFLDHGNGESNENASTSASSLNPPRLYLHPSFLLELLNTVYFAIFAQKSSFYALEALESLHNRASYELFEPVLLATNAMIYDVTQNATVFLPRGQDAFVTTLTTDDGIISPTSESYTEPSSSSSSIGPLGRSLSKLGSKGRGLVTNASLRIKKLPDDIPVRLPNLPLKEVAIINDEKRLSSHLPSLLEVNDKLESGKSHNSEKQYSSNLIANVKHKTVTQTTESLGRCDLPAMRPSNSTMCMQDLQKRAQAAEYAVCIRDFQSPKKIIELKDNPELNIVENKKLHHEVATASTILSDSDNNRNKIVVDPSDIVQNFIDESESSIEDFNNLSADFRLKTPPLGRDGGSQTTVIFKDTIAYVSAEVVVKNGSTERNGTFV
uniref:Hyccin n=1 Tax=Romanomermis culicivorax TaxID=13658 RepID=A0A915HX28_ROMCU